MIVIIEMYDNSNNNLRRSYCLNSLYAYTSYTIDDIYYLVYI